MTYCSEHGTLIFQQMMRFCAWMQSRRTFPMAAEVADHFDVSRATAYRWLRAWADANGVQRPAPGSPMPRPAARSSAMDGLVAVEVWP